MEQTPTPCICGKEHSIYCRQCEERRTLTARTIEQTYEVYRCDCDTVYVIEIRGHNEQRCKPSESVMNILIQTRDYLMEKIALVRATKGEEDPSVSPKNLMQADRQVKQKLAKLDTAVKVNDLPTVTSLCRSIIQEYRKHIGW